MDLINRAVLEARDDKSFWDKYKALIIGGAAAIPIQLVALWFYLRYRKRKKAAALQKQNEEAGTSGYSMSPDRHRLREDIHNRH
ncbi:hypothetical protein BGZ60DRAFT_532297 [Tricladium varicosporioides]|nr:hypothetical protein BGZ60DRAFT_532297 [Hymenoscyphus varicosporioides]